MNSQRIMDSLDGFMDGIENCMDGIEDYMECVEPVANCASQLSDLIADLKQAAEVLNPQDLLTLLGRAQDLLRRYAPESKYHRAVQDMIYTAEQLRRASQGGEKSTA